ncbi:hypothetical protein [Parachlamydia acanthamoebae]|uniref:hypothetical protein n=1 Tax=Parachlamydia acanthamoebae TaxID=83552 RepID=UPI0007511A08|nr:hypothetical protein [Parachlamydia acanthamoebae]
MKKNIYVYFFMILVFCYAVNSFAEDKIYVEPNRIIVLNSGIFVEYNDVTVQVDSIHCDDQGIFLINSAIQSPQEWVCGRCYSHNWPWEDTCYYCRKNRFEN